MKLRVVLLILMAILLGGCMTTASYGTSGYSRQGVSVGVGVGYSHGVPYGVFRGGIHRRGNYPGSFYRGDIYREYPGDHGYYDQEDYYGSGYYRGGYYYRDDYYRSDYGYGYPRHYSGYPHGSYRGYPYGPGYRVIHPGRGYYGQPYYRSNPYDHRTHPRLTPRAGGRPPWRNITPPPPVINIQRPDVPPPALPQPDLIPRNQPAEEGIERGLRRYKGSELPPED